MSPKDVKAGEWYIYRCYLPWLIIKEDDCDWGETAYQAINEEGQDGIVFVSELTPVEL